MDYLLKPYTRDRFALAVQKVITGRTSSDNHIRNLEHHWMTTTEKYFDWLLVEKGARLIGLRTSDILWLEAEGDYTRLHAESGQYLSNYGIGALEKKLNPALFVGVHRSALVNIHHIAEVFKEPSGPQLKLSNGAIIKVSRSYQDSIRQFMI